MLRIEKEFIGYRSGHLSAHTRARADLAFAYRLQRLADKTPEARKWLSKKVATMITGRGASKFLPVLKLVMPNAGKSAQSQYAQLLDAVDRANTKSKVFASQLEQLGIKSVKKIYIQRSAPVRQQLTAARTFIKYEKLHTLDCSTKLAVEGRFIALGSFDRKKGKLHVATIERCTDEILNHLLKLPGYSQRTWRPSST